MSGVAYGRWIGGGKDFLIELSRAVSVPNPSQLKAWWEPLIYFPLTAISTFVLAQLFFGVGAMVFLFSRGVSDGMMIIELERMVRGWSFPDLPINEIWMMIFMLFILFVNLPLCLWAAQVGTQRSIYVWCRLRGKPVKAGAGS
ncbi:MAG: hypothetical protein NZ934_02000, partial [Hadesarchaea archaeon]|nr:hypothetical protein [Hadesarchaea archaeon]